jgi:hypothetical protein
MARRWIGVCLGPTGHIGWHLFFYLAVLVAFAFAEERALITVLESSQVFLEDHYSLPGIESRPAKSGNFQPGYHPLPGRRTSRGYELSTPRASSPTSVWLPPKYSGHATNYTSRVTMVRRCLHRSFVINSRGEDQ